MRKSKQYHIDDRQLFLNQLIEFARNTNPFVLLDSAEYDHPYHKSGNYIAALDALDTYHADFFAINKLNSLKNTHNDWLFGHITYDVKNELENLHSHNPDQVHFPYFQFFRPKYVIIIEPFHIEILYPDFIKENEIDHLVTQIKNFSTIKAERLNIQLKGRQSKESYLEVIQQLKIHIRRGDIYELNYATEFYHNQAVIDPYRLYHLLRHQSPAPMSCFYKTNHHYLLSGSPERYISKTDTTLLSQPIKGTIKRGENFEQDELLKKQLLNSRKDRTENIMIADLVRNDLSRIALKGTVHADEICGLYTFRHWHQLISTISCRVEKDLPIGTVFSNTFPMGSMTGAPKIRAMQLIEKYEVTKRGIFSGTVGYIKPNGDFDFNVVIRSLVYNQQNHYLSCMVGGAITSQSIPEAEYEECLLKATGISQLLNQSLSVHAS
ncbi:MAG: aminodeoxychorismate synthase component I [Bacteroidetes bacterium]|jgi:para-aminobenzoate synthetase component 1|nr:aminodeoxychorismate synthase component I [Bacteroidota bacterium]